MSFLTRIDKQIVRNPNTGKVDHRASAEANLEAARGTVQRAFDRDSATIPIVRNMVDAFEVMALPGAAKDYIDAGIHRAIAFVLGN